MGTEFQIVCENVGKSYKKKQVLERISLEIHSGEIFGLLGPSGAGKTTLIKMMAGLETPTSGSVQVMDRRMPNMEVFNEIGYMGQSDSLYGELSAKENLHFFGALYGLNKKRLKQRIQEVMEMVSLQDDLNKVVNQYSGGMKRRLSLAIALLHEPSIVILDEPTVGIDPVLRNVIWKELERLSSKGMTIIVTTHVMDEAEKCHRIGLIREGRLLACGTPFELKELTSTSSIEQAFLYYGGGNQ